MSFCIIWLKFRYCDKAIRFEKISHFFEIYLETSNVCGFLNISELYNIFGILFISYFEVFCDCSKNSAIYKYDNTSYSETTKLKNLLFLNFWISNLLFVNTYVLGEYSLSFFKCKALNSIIAMSQL